MTDKQYEYEYEYESYGSPIVHLEEGMYTYEDLKQLMDQMKQLADLNTGIAKDAVHLSKVTKL